MPPAAPVLVTFARPEESSAFRKRLAPASPTEKASYCLGDRRVAVVHTGIGPAAARVAAGQFSPGDYALIILAGFAGALDPSLQVGDVIFEELPPRGNPRLVSVNDPLETAAAKAALHQQTGAVAVDMETGAMLAKWASTRTPMVAVRAISDSAREELPIPFPVWFNLARQRPRPAAILRYLLLQPSKIAPFARFVFGLGKARRALALAVEAKIRALEHD